MGLSHYVVDAFKPRLHLKQRLFLLFQKPALKLIVKLLFSLVFILLLMRFFNSCLMKELRYFGPLLEKLVAENHQFLGCFGVEVSLLVVLERLLNGCYLLLALLKEYKRLLVLFLPDELSCLLACTLELLD